MPALILNFQSMFTSYVREGSKTHTLRADRSDGKVPKPGERLDCYTGLRVKGGALLLGRWPCVRTQRAQVTVEHGMLEIYFDGVRLSRDEAQQFAWRDGFRGAHRNPLDQMVSFWVKHHSIDKSELWTGHLYHWDFTRPMEKPPLRARR